MTLTAPAPVPGPAADPAAAPVRVASAEESQPRLGVVSGLGLGVAVLWLSLLVLLPLAAIVVRGLGLGWDDVWHTITARESLAAIRLTVFSALGVALVNAVMGTLIAWVLVRDPFPGRRVIEVLIDVPFALPTIVAGLVMLTLYGQDSPVGVHLLGTRAGVVLALLFVTLPFTVRSVQPVLLALDREAEAAAESLGASPFTAFRRVVLPPLLPAIAAGATLSFARAMGEYGSVILIAAGRNNTRVASSYIYTLLNDDNDPHAFEHAAVVATFLLLISVVVILVLSTLQRWAARRA